MGRAAATLNPSAAASVSETEPRREAPTRDEPQRTKAKPFTSNRLVHIFQQSGEGREGWTANMFWGMIDSSNPPQEAP